jgi:hypothetical protein
MDPMQRQRETEEWSGPRISKTSFSHYSVTGNRIEPPQNSRVPRARDLTTVEESWRHSEVGGEIRRRDLQLVREGEKACAKQRSDDNPISTLLYALDHHCSVFEMVVKIR